MNLKILFLTLLIIFNISKACYSQYMLVPMDHSQRNHLKAYGIAYKAIQSKGKVEWLLNYRGGSFVCPAIPTLQKMAKLKDTSFELLDGADLNEIYALIEQENMERIILEKAPEIAVYAPSYYQPWDDAVMLALEYAEIPYTRVYDDEVLAGKLTKYDWLHLHHEDFTGQYGKFYANFGLEEWYLEQKHSTEEMATKLG
ncbi:MAG: hypothetical protein KAR38_06245 [Calditrichia bacterium]|nr:hypothetical protein [Calditrichia bacterium]